MQLTPTHKGLTGLAVGLLGLACFSLSGCIPPAPEPTPVPTPAPTPTPVASEGPVTLAPPPTPVPDNWLDLPATSGDWRWQSAGGMSEATFGRSGSAAIFQMSCAAATRDVIIFPSISDGSALPTVEIRTETTGRTFLTTRRGDGQGAIIALPANDAFLDAIAQSRGRFAVQVSGQQALYLPAWPEIARVVEDCRR